MDQYKHGSLKISPISIFSLTEKLFIIFLCFLAPVFLQESLEKNNFGNGLLKKEEDNFRKILVSEHLKWQKLCNGSMNAKM